MVKINISLERINYILSLSDSDLAVKKISGEIKDMEIKAAQSISAKRVAAAKYKRGKIPDEFEPFSRSPEKDAKIIAKKTGANTAEPPEEY